MRGLKTLEKAAGQREQEEKHLECLRARGIYSLRANGAWRIKRADGQVVGAYASKEPTTSTQRRGTYPRRQPERETPMTTDTRYAVLSVTELYGPQTKYDLVSLHDTRDEAQAVADAYDPDYDQAVNAHRLGHNQLSSRRGIVGEVVSEGAEIYDDWQLAPADVLAEAERMWDETVAHYGAEEEAEAEDTYGIMDEALRLSGYVALRTNGDTASGNRACELLVLRLIS